MELERNKVLLTKEDWQIYRYFEKKAKEEPNKWLTKDEIIKDNANILSISKSSAHDICSKLNQIRLKLNSASNQGVLSHLILLNNNKMKMATSREEAETYLYRDYKIGIKRLVRYYKNMKVIQEDGQGRLIDRKGNVITEDSLAKRFNEVFEY